MGKAEKNDAWLEALKKKACEKIMGVVEKFKEDPNIVINVEDESPEYIVLGIRVINPENKESKIYRKGFVKTLKFPNGLSVEEEVERQIRFPEGDYYKGD